VSSGTATDPPRSFRVESFAWRPVSLVAAACGLLVFGLSARYGYHRDELYFLASGRHLAWGYPDQPPLVPLLARAMSAIAPGNLLVLRLPSDIAVVGTVLLTAAIARELGASRSGQTLGAAAIAISNLTLGSGHLLSTTTFGLTVWAAFFAVSLHALRTRHGRWWLLAGVVAGVGLLDNDLVAFLLAATFVGLMLVGPRDVFRSPWLWLGLLVAALLWTPYLVWQAQHGWPQLQISRSIAAGHSGTSAPRGQIPLQQLFLASPVLDPLWIAGLVRLLRDPRVNWARAFAVAWFVLLLTFVVTGGKPYYLALSFPLLLAAGAQPALNWVRRGRRRLVTWTALLLVGALIDVVVTLPIIPIGVLHDTPIVGVNYDAGEQVGWPTFVREIVDTEVIAGGKTSVLLASNYGEAGAVQRYAPSLAARVYGVQNAYWLWGPPPEAARGGVVAVGFERSQLTPYFTTVELARRLDNGVGVDNDEQGEPVWICTCRHTPWIQIWRALKDYG
jgi:4-amino-4-deoxy-L-arabinose transferase-like glycosyltransferase